MESIVHMDMKKHQNIKLKQHMILLLIVVIFSYGCMNVKQQPEKPCEKLDMVSKKLAMVISTGDADIFYDSFLPSTLKKADWSKNPIFMGKDSAFLSLKNLEVDSFLLDVNCFSYNGTQLTYDSIWKTYVDKKRVFMEEERGAHFRLSTTFIPPIDGLKEIINVGYILTSVNNQKYKLSFFMHQYYNDDKWYISEIDSYELVSK